MMANYSFRPKNTNEFVKSINANSVKQAVEYFAQIKNLPVDSFNKLYEVIKR